jgi:hypothetical protein
MVARPIVVIFAAVAASCVVLACVTVVMPPRVAPTSDDLDATVAVPHRLGASNDPVATAWSYAAGTSGTVTVPARSYVSGITACAGGDAAGATVTVGAVGTAADGAALDGSAGPTVTVPISGCWSPPSLEGFRFSLGPGAVLTFVGTTNYTVTYAAYGSF